MASLTTSLGLRLSADGTAAQVYLGPNAGRLNNNMAIGLVGTLMTGYFLQRTDSGRNGTVWDMSSLDLKINLGGAQGVVTCAYLYSDEEFDLTDSADRTELANVLSADTTIGILQTLAAQTGRFRYLRFTLTSTSSLDAPTVTEVGESQSIGTSVDWAELVVLSTSADEVSRSIVVTRKSTPTMLFYYATSLDGLLRFDITGGAVTLSLAKSVNSANRQGFPIWGDLDATITDGTLGEVSVQLDTTKTNLEPGNYVMQVEFNRGSTSLRHLIGCEITDSFL